MVSVYDLCKTTLQQGGFNLNEKLRELTSIMIVKQISIDEYEELAELARSNADVESNPNDTNVLGALQKINKALADIETRLKALETAGEEDVEEDVYPEWERWDGQPDSGYRFGDKVTHMGIKYVSNFVGLNTWEPGLQGTEALWAVVA